IALAWTDNAVDETEFRIERRIGAGTYTQIATAAANATAYVDDTLSAETTATYRVRARNTAGLSPFSNEATATTFSGIPLPPSMTRARGTGPNSLLVTWKDLSSNEAEFVVEIRELASAGGTPRRWTYEDGPWQEVATTAANVTSAELL